MKICKVNVNDHTQKNSDDGDELSDDDQEDLSEEEMSEGDLSDMEEEIAAIKAKGTKGQPQKPVKAPAKASVT